MLKRDQMRRLAAVVRKPYFKKITKELDEVDCEDLLRVGQLLGGYKGIRDAFNNKDVPIKVKVSLRQIGKYKQSVACDYYYWVFS